MNSSSFKDIKVQIAEVKERVAGLGEALSNLESFVDRLESAVGPLLAMFPQHLPGNSNVTQAQPKPSAFGVPALVKDRVKAVIRESGGGIKPMDIKAAYIAKGWPMKDEQSLYMSIRTSIAMMKKQGEIAASDSGYFVKG
ncbi:MAG: hypothetical protein ABIW76_13970 [Fibrobacteria bacterium]